MERKSTLVGACALALMVSIGAPASAGETPSGQGRQGIAGYTVTYQHAAAGTRDDPVITETRTGDPQAKWGGNGNGPPGIGDQQTRTWLEGPNSGGGYQYREVTERWQYLNAPIHGPPGAGDGPQGWAEVSNVSRPATLIDCNTLLHTTCSSL